MEPFTVEIKGDKLAAIVVDIDGTIANITERLNRAYDVAGVTAKDVADRVMFYRNPKHKVFYEELFNPDAMASDIPIDGAAEALEILSHQFSIFYMTSRPDDSKNGDDRVKEATQKWLHDNGFPDGVLMIRDRRMKAHAFRVQSLAAILNDHYFVAFAIDDLYDGKDAYDINGIRVIQVKENVFVIPTIVAKFADGTVHTFEWVKVGVV